MKNFMWKKSKDSKKCGKLLRPYNRTVDGYTNIDYKQMIKMLKEDKNIVLLDVRSNQEYNEGHINGAVSIPLYEIETTIEAAIPDKKQDIIVYCKSGIRSVKAIEILIKKRYTNLYNLYGGLDNN